MSDSKINFLHFDAVKGEKDILEEGRTWKILIVDDDDEIHAVTKLVLRDKLVLGRRLELLSVKSAREAREFLAADKDVAVILLDVVMETDDAGLILAEWIRKDLGNSSVRIILRTGQPGMAPIASVITKYEINDYKEKTELTYDKLWSAIVTAIRGYRDIKTIEQSKIGMKMVLQAAPVLFKLQSLKLFASGILIQLISILNAGRNAALVDISGFAANISDNHYKMLAGTGKFKNIADYELVDALGDTGASLMDEATKGKGIAISGNNLAICIKNEVGDTSVIYIEECGRIDEVDHDLIALFCTNVSAAFTNIGLYNELEDRLDEKAMLIREIHHRVKNNLQVILSLVDLTDKTAPNSSLNSIRRRIAAMAVIHDRVSNMPNEKRIDFSECAADIAADVAYSSATDKEIPTIVTDTENFMLPLETAVPCSLLIEELLSHAVATKKPGSPVQLRLRGNALNEHYITVIYDLGGKSVEAEDDNLLLAKNLIMQVNGNISMESTNVSTTINAFFLSK